LLIVLLYQLPEARPASSLPARGRARQRHLQMPPSVFGAARHCRRPLACAPACCPGLGHRLEPLEIRDQADQPATTRPRLIDIDRVVTTTTSTPLSSSSRTISARHIVASRGRALPQCVETTAQPAIRTQYVVAGATRLAYRNRPAPSSHLILFADRLCVWRSSRATPSLQ